MQTTEKIIEHPLIKVKISDLVFDPSNPNQMTDKQMEALALSMKRYGYLMPIVIGEDNHIADGEHRVIIYKALGYKEIPAIRMKLETEADRKQLRQVLNKLHGIHDKAKDADEFLEIMQNSKSGYLEELAQLVGQSQQELMDILNLYKEDLDKEITDIDKDTDFLEKRNKNIDVTGETRLTINFKMPDKESFILVTECLATVEQVYSKEEALIKVIQEYVKQQSNQTASNQSDISA